MLQLLQPDCDLCDACPSVHSCMGNLAFAIAFVTSADPVLLPAVIAGVSMSLFQIVVLAGHFVWGYVFASNHCAPCVTFADVMEGAVAGLCKDIVPDIKTGLDDCLSVSASV